MNDTLNTHERQVEGRTVRDIAERSPALVNEVWCRKILRQVLQSLDAQYTHDGPHRLIMPDTIVVQANGDAVLLPDPDANPDFQPEVAADLRALAAVIHYAITHEMPAAGPLMGRGLEGYSDSLLGAVDRCMAPNKSQRPQSVSELRDLLGMVSVGLLRPSAIASAAPLPPVAPVAPAAVIAKPADPVPKASARKWLWLIIAAVLLAAALYIVRQHGAEKLVGATASVPAAVPAALAADTATPASAPPPDAAPAPEAEAEAPPAAAPEPAAPATITANATATYRLNVKPWGTIYVDGKRRGVSPPMKRLVLPAGRHTVMVENPGFADHIVEINSPRGASGLIAHDFTASEPAMAN
jgi:hypothetical protein